MVKTSIKLREWMMSLIKKIAVFLLVPISITNVQAGFLENMIKDILKSIEKGMEDTNKDYDDIDSNIRDPKKSNQYFIVLSVESRVRELLGARDNELENDLYHFLRNENFAIEPPWSSIKKYTDEGLAISPNDIRALSHRLGYSSFGYLVVGMPLFPQTLTACLANHSVI